MSASGLSNRVQSLVAVVLAVWLALVFVLGSRGAFSRLPGEAPLPIGLGVTLPVIAFLVMYWLSSAFREFVLNFDLRLAAAIQAWRFAGLGFIALHVHGVLPGVFAWPAGLGDIAVGATAPWVMLSLIRKPAFAQSRMFLGWNLFGMLDLVVAVSTGALNSALATGTPGEISAAPMASLPLVLIPAYFVPIFFMLHLTSIFQARHVAAAIA